MGIGGGSPCRPGKGGAVTRFERFAFFLVLFFVGYMTGHVVQAVWKAL